MKIKQIEGKSEDPDEEASYELSHLDLCCLKISGALNDTSLVLCQKLLAQS